MPEQVRSPSPANIVDHFFRHESGRVISLLVKYFGTDQFEKVEDAVQDAMVKAMQVWAYKSVPDNPSAWILRVAKNSLLDQLRRHQNFHDKEASIAAEIETISSPKEPLLDEALNDGLLKMLFACCHAAIPVERQIVLSLKVLCGFSNQEIARALLKSEAAIAKSYTRARTKLQDHVKELEVPSGAALERSLQTVLKTIYLLYNEGYNAANGQALIKKEVCAEAMRLAMLLIKHPKLESPEVHALMSLMCFQASRFEARIAANGDMINLEDQDRSLWEDALILQGRHHLEVASERQELSEYLIQASIAACHCYARTFAETNWERILMLYDLLIKMNPSNIVKLNRAVALSRVSGAQKGLNAIEQIEIDAPLFNYYLLHAIKGQLCLKLNQSQNALKHYRNAIKLTNNAIEQRYLQRQIDEITS
jgi:RNA polymerase sigma-70 factor (ECF subfamily)